jgi:hypothetical protein
MLLSYLLFRGQDSTRRVSRRSSGRILNQDASVGQPQDSERAGHNRAAVAARQRRRGDRMKRSSIAELRDAARRTSARG